MKVIASVGSPMPGPDVDGSGASSSEGGVASGGVPFASPMLGPAVPAVGPLGVGLPSVAAGVVAAGVVAAGALGTAMLVSGAEGVDGIALLVLIDGVSTAPSPSLPHALRSDRATAALNPIKRRRRRASVRVICPC